MKKYYKATINYNKGNYFYLGGDCYNKRVRFIGGYSLNKKTYHTKILIVDVEVCYDDVKECIHIYDESCLINIIKSENGSIFKVKDKESLTSIPFDSMKNLFCREEEFIREE